MRSIQGVGEVLPINLAFVDLGEQQLETSRNLRLYRISGEQFAAARVAAKPAPVLPDKPSIAVLLSRM